MQLPERVAPPRAILLFDGIFLHRPELLAYWDYSIFLEVRFAISIPRGAQRGEGSPDPEAPSNHRYIQGQQLYVETACPQRHAAVVINNEDLDRPFIIRPAEVGTGQPVVGSQPL